MKPTLPQQAVDLLPQLEEALNVRTIAGKAVLRIFLENTLLMERKQLDYGPTNISKYGLMGVAVRLSDKVERIATLMGQRRRKPQNESLEDSFKDACNYGAIAQALIQGQWPTAEPLLHVKTTVHRLSGGKNKQSASKDDPRFVPVNVSIDNTHPSITHES